VPNLWGRVEQGASRYQRRLADVALGGRRMVIVLAVRRLFCDAAACDRRTFAEQVPGLTVRYGRRTPLLRGMLEEVSAYTFTCRLAYGLTCRSARASCWIGSS